MTIPTWAVPQQKTKSPDRRNVPIQMGEDEIERADAVAAVTGQTRSQLLKRIIKDALFSTETEHLLRGRK